MYLDTIQLIGRNDEYCAFGGLVNPSKASILLYGCPGSLSWYFAVGRINGFNHGMPSNNSQVRVVSLWVKYNIIEPRITCFCSYSNHMHLQNILLCIYLCVTASNHILLLA